MPNLPWMGPYTQLLPSMQTLYTGPMLLKGIWICAKLRACKGPGSVWGSAKAWYQGSRLPKVKENGDVVTQIDGDGKLSVAKEGPTAAEQDLILKQWEGKVKQAETNWKWWEFKPKFDQMGQLENGEPLSFSEQQGRTLKQAMAEVAELEEPGFIMQDASGKARTKKVYGSNEEMYFEYPPPMEKNGNVFKPGDVDVIPARERENAINYGEDGKIAIKTESSIYENANRGAKFFKGTAVFVGAVLIGLSIFEFVQAGKLYDKFKDAIDNTAADVKEYYHAIIDAVKDKQSVM